MTRRLALPVVATSVLLLAGCPNPNTYGTARTTTKGEVAVTIAPEVWGFSSEVKTADTSTKIAGTIPMLPSVGLRYGVTDRFDIGARVPNLSSLAGDVKLNLLKGSFDLALDPGVQYFSISSSDSTGSTSVKVMYLFAPLLMDFNLNETFSFVLAPGVTYAYASASADFGSDAQAAAASDGIYGRLGLGFDIRVSKKFALHPEVTVQRGFEDGAFLQYMAGLGFNFGGLPDFSTAPATKL